MVKPPCKCELTSTSNCSPLRMGCSSTTLIPVSEASTILPSMTSGVSLVVRRKRTVPETGKRGVSRRSSSRRSGENRVNVKRRMGGCRRSYMACGSFNGRDRAAANAVREGESFAMIMRPKRGKFGASDPVNVQATENTRSSVCRKTARVKFSNAANSRRLVRVWAVSSG